MNGNDKNKRKAHQAFRKQAAFDWDDVRRRIAAASAALSDLEETAPEVMEQVWARRAERLAQAPVKRDEGEQIQLAVLRLGCEVYGLDVQYVFDIRPVEHITPVPRVPSWVAGVVNLRGHIFSVIDLQRLLGLPRETAESASDGGSNAAATRYLAVVEASEIELGLLVDEVLPLEVVPVNGIHAAAGAVRGIRPEYMRGITERGNGDSLVVLDLPALLADQQLLIHEEIV